MIALIAALACTRTDPPAEGPAVSDPAGPPGDAVARADGSTLTVDQAAALLAANPRVRPDTQLVRALADRWVDYTLLALAMADDSAGRPADVEALVAPDREQALAMKLRDRDVGAAAAAESVRVAVEAEERREEAREDAEEAARGSREGDAAEERAEQDRELRREFRRRDADLAVGDAERAYIAAMTRDARLTVGEGAPALVRALAARPDRPLPPDAAAREVARYDGGRVTAEQLRTFLLLQPSATLGVLAGATAAQATAVVEQLARKELLVRRARERGLALTPAEEAALVAQARADLRGRARAAGLGPLVGRRPARAAVDSAVRDALRASVSGAAPLPALGDVGPRLRAAHPHAVEPRTFALAAARAGAAGAPAVNAASPSGPNRDR